MTKVASVFGIEESARFARALAEQADIRVVHEDDTTEPYTDTSGRIHIGIPSIYNHEDYMGSLHREISKSVPEVDFFQSTKVAKGDLQKACKDIIQTEVTERYRHGIYEGRDRHLKQQYSKQIQQAGGIREVVTAVAQDNPTLGALMYINNELRNKWQGYEHCPAIPEIQDELDRLGFLEEEWMSLETEDDLKALLHRIEYEEPPPKEEEDDGEGEGNGGDGGSSGESSESSQQEDQGETSSGDGQSDQGGQDPEAGGESPEDSRGEEQPEEGSGEPKEGTEEPKEGEASPPEGEGSDSENGDPDESQSNGIGASAGYNYLKNMGLIKPPISANDAYFDKNANVPYIPDGSIQTTDLTKNKVQTPGRQSEIKSTLGTLNLSRKMKKYLISMSQTGYEYGLKKGKLCNKNVAKLYTGSERPTIFKKRQASRIMQDTAVFILGDCSGSMSGEKYLTSAACQVALSEVLQALHIPHMMMQFTTGSGIRHYITKNFEERFVSRDTLIDRYGAGNIRMGCNADGEAVTQAAQILARRKEKQKILIVLSDGSPAYGYGDDSRFLKDTVASIEQSNVMDIYGIGIRDKNVERFYSDNRVIKNVNELEPVLLELLRSKVLK